MPELKEVRVKFISLVDIPANKRGIIWKSENQMIIPIAKINKEKKMVYGIVYAPNEEDTDGDFMTPEEIEKMAYDFMKNGRTRNVDRQHDFQPDEGFVAESWLIRKNDPLFPHEKEGAWAVGIKVENKETWEDIKKGVINGISLAGVGRRVNKSFENILKPYPNEHSARVRDPKDFDPKSFRRKEIADGISIIIGKLKDDDSVMVVQAYRFKKDKFTPEQAKKWLKEHNIKYILFEPAKKEERKVMKFVEKIKKLFSEKKDVKLNEIAKSFADTILELAKNEASEEDYNKEIEAFTSEIEKFQLEKAGRVLSKKNEELLKEVVQKLQSILSALGEDTNKIQKEGGDQMNLEEVKSVVKEVFEKEIKTEILNSIDEKLKKFEDVEKRLKAIEESPLGKLSIDVNKSDDGKKTKTMWI